MPPPREQVVAALKLFREFLIEEGFDGGAGCIEFGKFRKRKQKESDPLFKRLLWSIETYGREGGVVLQSRNPLRYRAVPSSSASKQSYRLVDSASGATSAISSLGSLEGLFVNTKDGDKKIISMDMEGQLTSDGKASLLQLCGPSPDKVYILDIYECPDILKKKTPLRQMLMGSATIKIVHDCRGDADALRGQFGIDLKMVWDTQVAHSVLNPGSPVISLNKALELYANKSNVHKETVQHRPGLWEKRPMDAKLLEYAADDVRFCARLFVEQFNRMTPAQRRETFDKSMEYVRARTDQGREQIEVDRKARAKKSRVQAKALIDESADRFFQYLTEKPSLLISIKDLEALTRAFNSWKILETKNGKAPRGGADKVASRLVAKGHAKKRLGQWSWTPSVVELVKAKSTPKVHTSAVTVPPPAKELKDRIRDVLENRESIDDDRNGISITPKVFSDKVVKCKVKLQTIFKITNTSGENRSLEKIIIPSESNSSSFRANFTARHELSLPAVLKPGQSVSVSVQTTTPKNYGTFRAVLCVFFSDCWAARTLSVTCGNPIVSELQRTSEYKRKERKGDTTWKYRRTLGDEGRGKAQPFAKSLPMYSPPNKILELIRLGEGGYHFNDTLGPLSENNYDSRFKDLLWFEEFAQVLDLEQFDLEGVTMKVTTGGRLLSLRVEGLAEKRPSLMLYDEVIAHRHNEKSKSGVNYRGIVRAVERDRVLLSFPSSLLQMHDDSRSLYDVHFQYKRVPMRLAHQGLDHARSLRPDALFPQRLGQLSPLQGLTLFNRELNPEQCEAVRQVTQLAGRRAPYLLYGPPGTGKTTTLVEMIAQAVKSGRKVLAVAPTNAAADVICERLHQVPTSPCGKSLVAVGDGKMLRMMAFSRSPATVPRDVLDHCPIQNGEFTNPTMEMINNAKVIVATLTTGSKLYNLCSSTPCFDSVFVDEAGQALEPEVMSVLASMLAKQVIEKGQIKREEGQVILAGDHQQLGPIVLSATSKQHGLALSYLERLSKLPLYTPRKNGFPNSGGYDPLAITMLTRNYRSHSDIIHVSNELFYESALKACGAKQRTHSLVDWKRLPTKGVPLIVHNIVGQNDREASSPSWFNPDEAGQVLEYVQELLEHASVEADHIGIIAPYHKQVQKIKKALKSQNINIEDGGVKVGSTEMFQGQERRIIIISTVRSDPTLVESDVAHNLGFVSNAKRFNVAVTRAQALLIVVGNAELLSTDKNWEALLSFGKAKGAWRGAPFKLPSETAAK